jgi:hypothetical protein
MWSSVLGLSLLAALNLVRLGFTLLVISRPRPVRNLLAFCAGCLTGAIPVVVIPLILLHATTMFTSFTQGSTIPATNSTIRHVQFGMGVLALLTSALIAVRTLTRRRRRAQLLSRGAPRGRRRKSGATSTLVLDLDTPTANSRLRSRTEDAPPAFQRLLSRAQDAPTDGASAFRRLLHRAHNAWENGSLWVAFVLGVVFGGPPPGEALFLFAIVATSGATVGTQIVAAAVYVVGMLAVIEIMLVGYVATPARAHALLGRLHDWTLAHRRWVVVAIFVVVGVALMARGTGSI